MAIKTVNQDNLADYVANRVAKGSELSTAKDVQEMAQKADSARNPVVAEVVETSPDAPPDPGVQTRGDKPKRNGVQERIDELTREKKELDEFAQSEYEARLQAQRRIDELESQVKQLQPVKEAPKEELEPDPTAFTDQKEFLKKWGEWQRTTARKEFAAEQAKLQDEARIATANELLKARVEKAKIDIPDFEDVIERADRTQILVPNHIQAAIVDSDLGPQLAYHLAKHPDEQKRIFALSPAKALLELGKIEIQYEKTGEPLAVPDTPVKTTRAPAPMTPLKVTEGQIPVDLSQPMPFRDFKAKRLAEIRRNRH